MANLTYLSDMIGPRLTGSESLKRANDWTIEKMKSYGLSNVHLEPWTIPTGWERGTAYAKIVEPNNGRSLIVASNRTGSRLRLPARASRAVPPVVTSELTPA